MHTQLEWVYCRENHLVLILVSHDELTRHVYEEVIWYAMCRLDHFT